MSVSAKEVESVQYFGRETVDDVPFDAHCHVHLGSSNEEVAELVRSPIKVRSSQNKHHRVHFETGAVLRPRCTRCLKIVLQISQDLQAIHGRE